MMHSNLALFTQRRNIFIEELKGIQSWTVQSLKLFHHDQQISIVSAFANSRWIDIDTSTGPHFKKVEARILFKIALVISWEQ